MDGTTQAYATGIALDIGPRLPPPIVALEYVTVAGPQCDERCTADGQCKWFYVSTYRAAGNSSVQGASACCHQLARFAVGARRPSLDSIATAHRKYLKARASKWARQDATNFERLDGGWRAFRIAALSRCVYIGHTARELAERLEMQPLRVAHHYVAKMRDLGLLVARPDENDEHDWRIPYRTTKRGADVLDWLREQELIRFDSEGEPCEHGR